jgi:hypothetical protein
MLSTRRHPMLGRRLGSVTDPEVHRALVPGDDTSDRPGRRQPDPARIDARCMRQNRALCYSGTMTPQVPVYDRAGGDLGVRG